MKKRLSLMISGAAFALAGALGGGPAAAETFYWVSHGSPTDPVWTYFLDGANRWAEDTGNEVNTSFHNGDVSSHQEAIRAAIASNADGIVTSTPDPGALVQVTEEAHARGIPVIAFNTPDENADYDADVGGNNVEYGTAWANYMVDNGLVEEGDFVWMPVEVPGATYGVQLEEGISSVFEPMNIEWEVTDASLDQAQVLSRMTDYLGANQDSVDAIIGLGDLVTGNIKQVFDRVGVEPGAIPVVGWGNSLETARAVNEGYVNAAQWQSPLATSYMALSMAAMATGGIEPGFDITVGDLYEAEGAQRYIDLMSDGDSGEGSNDE